jgi:cation transport ATPase
MPAGPLCGRHREGGQAERPQGQEDNAERRRRHSHAERGNERRRCGPLPVSLLQSQFLGLYVFTALLGLLIGGDVVLDWLGWTVQLPLGISLSLVAAVLGAVYIVHSALDALFHRRIGADFALAQASIAALVLGQPFVAAEEMAVRVKGDRRGCSINSPNSRTG